LRLLLDTHAFIWFLIEQKRIPQPLMAVLIDPTHVVYVSAASVWEATVKVGIGKLSLPLERLEAMIAASGFDELPLRSAHALELRHLPTLHRDPFDRLLIAQARYERLTLVTHDTVLRRYPVATLWN